MKKILSLCVLWGCLSSAAWGLDVPTYLDPTVQSWLMRAANIAKNNLRDRDHGSAGIFADAAEVIERFRENVLQHWMNEMAANAANYDAALTYESDPLAVALHWLGTQINCLECELAALMRVDEQACEEFYRLRVEMVGLIAARIGLGWLGNLDSQTVCDVWIARLNHYALMNPNPVPEQGEELQVHGGVHEALRAANEGLRADWDPYPGSRLLQGVYDIAGRRCFY